MQEHIVKAAVTEKEAAIYIGMSVPYLRASRCHSNRHGHGHGHGHAPAPPYIKAGRSIRYLISDLDHWLQQNRVELSAACE